MGSVSLPFSQREMSNYVFGTSLRYQDYLQAKSFEDTLVSEISSASRSIIATNEELSENLISVLGSMSSSMTRGFDRLSFDICDLSDGIAELNATFQWGFSEVLTKLGGLNDSLRELIKIAKTPAQTWAYEQFEIARDAFRRELYDDATQYLSRAINGHGDHTGYNIEYRFHFLLGTIRIGSFKNYSEQIVDPMQAEHAFLNAARYAKHDQPKEAARSYLGAGWAAYCQGNMRDAERHTRDAIALDDSLAEAHFQLAKIQIHGGNPETALCSLRTAITLDRGYTLKACTDGDFTRYQQKVDSLLETFRQKAKQTAQQSIYQIESDILHLEKSRAEQFWLAEDELIVSVRQLRDLAKEDASAGTYYGYLDAIRQCDAARHAQRSAFEELRKIHQQRHQQLLNDRETFRRERDRLRETPLPTNGNIASDIGRSIGMFFVYVLGFAIAFSVLDFFFKLEKAMPRVANAIGVVCILIPLIISITYVVGRISDRGTVVRKRQTEMTRIDTFLGQIEGKLAQGETDQQNLTDKRSE